MRPGEVVGGRFEILSVAGAGGMGVVWRARDRQDGGTVAVKSIAASADAARMERECRILAGLAHEAVVRTLGSWPTADGTPCLVMEWLDGEDLAARIARGPVPLLDSLQVVRRAAEGLGAAHAQGVVHRDVKPANIFLVGASVGEVKVIDFGVAWRAVTIAGLTAPGILLGTPGYMSPEQVRSSTLDPRTDVFGLGCVLYECLGGEPAFRGAHPLALLTRILLEEPRPIRPELPPAIESLLARMMAKDPSRRPRDGTEVAAELAGLVTDAQRPGAPAVSRTERRVTSVLVVAREERDGAARLDELVAGFGGRLESLPEGAQVVVFEAAGSASDLAARAAGCALAVHRELPYAPAALATGLAVTRGTLPLGDAVDRAVSLLPHRAPGGRPVQVDDVTAGLLGDRFAVRRQDGTLGLVGPSARRAAVRLLLGRETPCVGRDRELRELLGRHEECVRVPEAHAFLVTAGPGVGKSRLLHEVVRTLQDGGDSPSVWIARGEALSAGSTFGLLAQLVRDAFGLDPDEPASIRRRRIHDVAARLLPAADARRVTEFLGELVDAPPEGQDVSTLVLAARRDPRIMAAQIERAFAELVAAACDRGPVVLVLEDLHWGDAPTVLLVDRMLRELAERPLLVLAFGRPETETIFPALWRSRPMTHMRLGGLPASAGLALVRAVLEDAPGDLAQRIVQRADGNAFYLEELIRSARQGHGDGFPESVLAMAEARLGTLDDRARRALRGASVFGEAFWTSGVRVLLGGPPPEEVEVTLQELEQLELIRRRGQARFAGETEWAFRHALIREAAYATLTDEDRVLGHHLAGDWLEAAGERAALLLAEHLERGRQDERAAAWFVRAGEDAIAANDLASAEDRCLRAVRCGAEGSVLGGCRLVQSRVAYWRGDHVAAYEACREAIGLLAPGSAKWFEAIGSHGNDVGAVGRTGELEWLAKELLATAAEDSAEFERSITMLRVSIHCKQHGLAAAGAALFAEAEVYAASQVAADPRCAAWLYFARAYQAHHDGLPEVFLDELEASVACFTEIGNERTACNLAIDAAFAKIQVGRFADAEAELRSMLALAERMGLAIPLYNARQNLGLALLRLGRLEDAMEVLRRSVSEYQSARNLRLEGTSRLYLAEALMRSGQLDDAEREGAVAEELLRTAPPLHPFGLATQARTFLAQGRTEDACRVARRAHEALALGPAEEGEAVVRLTWAEALEASGDREGACVAIAEAWESVQSRAGRLKRPDSHRTFLAIEEHARTEALMRKWLG